MDIPHYAIIGHPIGHTMSPFIHQSLFRLSGTKGEYRILDIPPQDFGHFIPQLKALRGFNLTIPHKRSILPFLSEIDQTAKRCGSVNTVKNQNGRLIGYTTDGIGFIKALQAAQVRLNGNTLLLGNGGAARVMAFEVLQAGGTCTIAVRQESLAKGEALKKDLLAEFPQATVHVVCTGEITGSFDLLINGTPVGMYPHVDACPVPESVIRNCRAVFDAVYNPEHTLLLQKATAFGAKAVGGMTMLVWQAVAAHEIWNGSQFSPSDIEVLCADATREMHRLFGKGTAG